MEQIWAQIHDFLQNPLLFLHFLYVLCTFHVVLSMIMQAICAQYRTCEYCAISESKDETNFAILAQIREFRGKFRIFSRTVHGL